MIGDALLRRPLQHVSYTTHLDVGLVFFFFKQKTAYEIGLGIPAEPLFRSRASIKMIGVSNLQSFIASMTQKLTLSDISDESKNYLDKAGITTACLRIKSKWTAGGK